MMLVQINSIVRHPKVFGLSILNTCTMEASIKNKMSNPISDVQDCFENMTVSDYQVKNTEEDSVVSVSSDSSINQSAEISDHVDLNSDPSSDNFMCLIKAEPFLDSFEFNVSNQQIRHCKKTLPELNKYSMKQLQVLVEELTQSVEQVSSELVQLLLENDSLQQETDARNIAIEQLLKMTVNINESELKPIQMSVVLPDDDCDEV